jgi:hypothetical protein
MNCGCCGSDVVDLGYVPILDEMIDEGEQVRLKAIQERRCSAKVQCDRCKMQSMIEKLLARLYLDKKGEWGEPTTFRYWTK